MVELKYLTFDSVACRHGGLFFVSFRAKSYKVLISDKELDYNFCVSSVVLIYLQRRKGGGGKRGGRR